MNIEFNWLGVLNMVGSVLILGTLVCIFVVIIGIGVKREEVVVCRGLEKQSKEYELFFLTSNQKEMCDAHKIFINAPVISTK